MERTCGQACEGPSNYAGRPDKQAQAAAAARADTGMQTVRPCVMSSMRRMARPVVDLPRLISPAH